MYQKLDDSIAFFDLDEYTQINLIAASNNRVYLFEATQNQVPHFVAVKEMTVVVESRQSIERMLINNYKIQSTKHPNIVQIYGIVTQTGRRLSGQEIISYYICMEYLPNSLQQYISYIRQFQLTNNQDILKELTMQMISANQYLQVMNISHGDIKPENILVDDCINPTIFKLCDFDNLQIINKTKVIQKSNISTQQYQSPEIKEAISQGLEQFSYNPFKSQVYSLGLCLIQLHKDITLQTEIEQIMQFLRDEYNQGLAELILDMLIVQNNERPDFIILNNTLTLLESTFKMQNLNPKNIQQKQIVQSQFCFKSQTSVGTQEIFMDYYKDSYSQMQSNKTLSSDNILISYKQPLLQSSQLKNMLALQESAQKSQPQVDYKRKRRCGCQITRLHKILTGGVLAGTLLFCLLYLLL